MSFLLVIPGRDRDKPGHDENVVVTARFFSVPSVVNFVSRQTAHIWRVFIRRNKRA